MILTMPPLDWKSWNSWRIFLKPVAFSRLRFLYVVESALKNTEGFHRLWLSHLFKQTCIKYCWWFRNPASVEVGSLSHHLQGSIHPERWLGMGFLNLQLNSPESCHRDSWSDINLKVAIDPLEAAFSNSWSIFMKRTRFGRTFVKELEVVEATRRRQGDLSKKPEK